MKQIDRRVDKQAAGEFDRDAEVVPIASPLDRNGLRKPGRNLDCKLLSTP
jgi:hypothetical protein